MKMGKLIIFIIVCIYTRDKVCDSEVSPLRRSSGCSARSIALLKRRLRSLPRTERISTAARLQPASSYITAYV